MYKWLASLIIIAAAATGCTTAANKEPSPSPQQNQSIRAKQSDVKKEITDPNQVTAHLEQLAMSVNGVQNAHCVVFGNTAIVGIDVDEKLERSRVGTIKYSVAEALHKDPYGIDALVSADIDIAERLREIGNDIRAGNPITGFAEEMADIIGRIIPQLPRDIIVPDQAETGGQDGAVANY